MDQGDASQMLAEFSYVSRLAPGMPTTTPMRIARQAWSFNAKHELTGVLRYEAGRFVQVVEGPWSVILSLSSRILTDARHKAIAITALGPLRSRRFDGWHTSGIEAAGEAGTGWIGGDNLRVLKRPPLLPPEVSLTPEAAGAPLV